MRRVIVLTLACAAAVAACRSDTTAPDPDAIPADEKAAVQDALNRALGADTFYSELSLFVLPFVDRATRIGYGPGDTARFVAVQLDIDAARADTPIVAQLSGVLGWRHYRPATATVDSVFLVIGAGLTPPVADSLAGTFSPDSAGAGTGFVVAEAGDSTVRTWTAIAGALHVAGASYGGPVTTSLGGAQLSVSKGTVSGDFHLTGHDAVNGGTDVTAGLLFSSGIQALKIRITGQF